MERVLIFLLLVLLTSCSSTIVNFQSGSKDGPTFVVLPFENNTETPLAGLRVASITEGVASSKGYNLKKDLLTYQQKEYTAEEIQMLMKELRNKDVAYAITGSVNEFRYKAGIDGEPAVSVTLKIYSLKEQKLLYVSTASKSGWYFQSVSTLAQQIINKILPNAPPK
ncbi:MAG: hypothetical protein RMH93_06435 [Aquificaceae bacterium]|nr:hypothetical protein [Aquificaceae bacterium]MDW8033168.1 hypothetical protein [Aquificaceae bacterium]